MLGSSVQTGSSCQIVNSYIFAGAVLGDGCVVRDSVIGEGVQIAAGAVIEHGCLVAAGAVIGEGARLQGCRVSLEEYDGDEFEARGSTRESGLFRTPANVRSRAHCEVTGIQLGKGRRATSGPRRISELRMTIAMTRMRSMHAI